MSSLTDVNIKSVYRSGDDSLLEDFYIPALKYAKYYDRAVGFFSTSLLTYALSGISSIVKNGGKVRLVIGEPLDEDEFEALKQGYGLKNISNILMAELNLMINSASSGVYVARLKLFMLLIATERMEVKFAFKKDGMYHEKIGIIYDEYSNKILFQGSANETKNAISPDLNFESITVYKSWNKGVYDEYAKPFELGFERLWNGTERNVVTVDMPSEMYERISVEYFSNQLHYDVKNIDEIYLFSVSMAELERGYPKIPKMIKGVDFKLFPHQQDALRSWYENDCKGLFRLATGAGKTITAMYGVSVMFNKAEESSRKLLFIVAVPYQALAEQWVHELSMFNMKPIRCYSSRGSWDSQLRDKITLLNSGELSFVSVVVVNKTLQSDLFQSMVSRVDKKHVFFVGDECHRHANFNIKEKLPQAEYRIGLSATPYIDDCDFEFDEDNEEKEALISYYGKIVADYSLSDALNSNVLTPYKYYITAVRLSDAECDSYLELSKEIARLMAIDKSKNNIALSNAIRKRNKIISNAVNKSNVLDQLLKQQERFIDKSHTLFYVGEGGANTDDLDNYSHEMSQLELITKIADNNKWNVSKFTANERAKDRKLIMDSFCDGSIDALVSMKVLDEGIDIPKCKRAFILASSGNSRQFVQRRGRILRRSPGKDSAEIYDFVVLPRKCVILDDSFHRLVKRELTRVMDFVRLSSNRRECEADAKLIADEFNLQLEDC